MSERPDLPKDSARSERDLLASLRSGGSGAREELVRRHAGRLLLTARRLVGSEAAARDVVCQALAEAAQSADSCPERPGLAVWLLRLLVGRAMSSLRNGSRRPEAGGRSLDALLPSFTADGHHAESIREWPPRVRADALSGDQRARVRSLVGELPPEHRVALLLGDADGCSSEEIGVVLDRTPAEARLLLHQARQALRTLIGSSLEPQARRLSG